MQKFSKTVWRVLNRDKVLSAFGHDWRERLDQWEAAIKTTGRPQALQRASEYSRHHVLTQRADGHRECVAKLSDCGSQDCADNEVRLWWTLYGTEYNIAHTPNAVAAIAAVACAMMYE